MPWSATRILWDQQIFLMWILLPPVFLMAGVLAFAAPVLFRDKERVLPAADGANPVRAVAERH